MNTIKSPLVLILSVLVHAGLAQTWIQTSAPTNQWSSVACSADGTRIIASNSGSNNFPDIPIYVSTNSGGTWMKTGAPSKDWRSVASSADGTVLVASSGFFLTGAIYTSTNSGGTWTSNDVPKATWVSVACSADGKALAAASTNSGNVGMIYTSTNSGVTWTSNNVPNRLWKSIASSSDGTRLIAASGEVNGVIYTSTNSGATWTSNNAPRNPWQSVACSSDGMNLVAVGRGNGNSVPQGIYASTNSGETWVPTETPFLNWKSVVPRGESEFIAASSEGWVFISTDSGMNWKANGGFYQNFSAISSSKDGSKLFATSDNGRGFGGGIFASIVPSPPPLKLAVSGQNMVISWPWPSADFVLQKNSDLSSPDWLDVTNAPAVVNQVILSPTGDSEFYRLEAR